MPGFLSEGHGRISHAASTRRVGSRSVKPVSDLGGPVKSIRETPRPSRSAPLHPGRSGETRLGRRPRSGPGPGLHGADDGAVQSLPRTNPGNRTSVQARQRPLHALHERLVAAHKLPFGNFPRLMLGLGLDRSGTDGKPRADPRVTSLAEFMRALGIYNSDGKAYARLRNQMERLFNASVRLIYEDKHGKQFVSSAIADRGEFWWDSKRPNERVLWDSKIRLGEDFFNEIISHPVPIEMNTLTALKRSPLGLDLYLWLTYRTFALRAPLRLSWQQVYRQFGVEPDRASDKVTVQAFRRKVLRELKKIKLAWPELNYSTAPGVLILYPSTRSSHRHPNPCTSWDSSEVSATEKSEMKSTLLHLGLRDDRVSMARAASP